ncbi:gas vesicle protein GvpO [Streptomyces avermitilis]
MSNTSNTSKSQDSQNAQDAPRNERGGTAEKRPGTMEVLRKAGAQFAELTGLEAESVSSFERSEDGWQLQVEVLELARVPDTMSLLASYEVKLDPYGELTGYRRVRRYERGRADAR